MGLWSGFWEIMVWFLWAYVFIAFLVSLVFVLGDIFRDHSLNGWLKALWVIFLVFFPVIGVLVYIIARGKAMSERNAQDPPTVSEPDDYHPHIIPPASPAEEISKAQALLASGSITENEFAALKAKVLT